MAKKAKLSDLFVLEDYLEISDGKRSVTVLLKKMNPVDHETAFRKANAARARIAANRFNEDSEDFQSFYDQALDISKDVLIAGISAEKIEAEARVVEERIGDSEEWSKDEYLQGLLDAWNDELQHTYAMDPEDPEALRVMKALTKYRDQVESELDTFRDETTAVYEQRTIPELAKLYTERLMRLEGDMQWISEYRKSSILFMVFDPETRKPYFDNRAEINTLAQEVLNQLIAGIENLSVEVSEGKDSGETPLSSDSSEAPKPQEAE